MRKILSAAAAVVLAFPAAQAKERISPVGVDSLRFDRQGELMVVDMGLDLRPTSVRSRNAEIITPIITGGDSVSRELPSLGVYGRERYIYLQRNGGVSPWSPYETSFRESDRPDGYGYFATVPYEDWMDRSRLVIRRRLYGCVNCLLEERCDTLDTYVKISDPVPGLRYMEASASDVVIDSLAGAAYIDFIVDKTDIEPTYRRNPVELMKIQASIDTVLNDRDVRITGVWLKGFASPESPYSHNTDLAIGRTEAIRKYIQQLYKFDPSMIRTDYEPEDWEGLRRLVAGSNIDHREEILEIIDSDMAPDPKEAYMKRKFPKEYRFMLDTFYPALRHTEYKITYEVRRFDDIDRIRQVMRTRPNRLTLRQFYLLANSCEPGSDEYNDVYETAVRIYPDDPVANINAANAAIRRKDYDSAERYLARAGNTDAVRYGRAALAFSRGDYEQAYELLKPLGHMESAIDLMEEVRGILSHKAAREVNASRRLLE